VSAERLYGIAPQLTSSGGWVAGSDYYPGVAPPGEQVIVLVKARGMHAFRFDAAGRYLGRLDRASPGPPPTGDPGGRPGELDPDLQGWLDELGLRPATLRVRKFNTKHDGPSLYIRDYPMYFEDEGWDSEEEFQERFGWWLELGAFVLCWDGSDHWINGQGRHFQ
jgi:hypothetical protein